MNSQPSIDVSIVIPAYNAEDYIQQCVESVLLQSGIELEVIVVDDGSTDRTGDILASLANRDSRLKLIWQENAGVSATLNTAMRYSQGEFIAQLDNDDYLAEDKLASLIDYARTNDLDILHIESIKQRESGTTNDDWYRLGKQRTRAPEFDAITSGPDFLALEAKLKDIRAPQWYYLIRRKLVNDAGVQYPKHARSHQDAAFTFRAHLAANRVGLYRTRFVAHRIRPGSGMTAMSRLNNFTGALIAFLDMKSALEAADLPVSLSKELNDRVEKMRKLARRQWRMFGSAERQDAETVIRNLKLDDATTSYSSIFGSTLGAPLFRYGFSLFYSSKFRSIVKRAFHR